MEAEEKKILDLGLFSAEFFTLFLFRLKKQVWKGFQPFAHDRFQRLFEHVVKFRTPSVIRHVITVQ